MSHLTESMVEQFIEVEKENARGVLRKEMDSCMDTIFKQMKRKLMMLVESGRGGDETGHGLAHLSDQVNREQQLYESSNDTNGIPSSSINSRAQLSDLNVSNQSYQGGLNDLVYYGQQLYQSSNQFNSTSINQSNVPDKATSNIFHDDEITVKNELGEIVNIIPNNDSIPSSSTHSQSSNDEQSIDNIDDLFDEEEEEDCDCPDCVGELFVKMEEGDDDLEADDDDDVQLIEDSHENNESNPKPTKRSRIESDQSQDVTPYQEAQAQPNDQTNQNPFIIISLKCSQCSEMYPDKNALNAHLETVHSILKYRCLYRDCYRSFDKHTQLGHHLRTRHSTQPNITWPCNYCSGQYKNSTALFNHYFSYHEEGVFQCAYPDCQFTGELKQTVYNHYGANHKQLACQYPGCTKRYHKANLLRAHKRSHRNAKPYRCKWPDCQVGSAYMSNIMLHIRKHLARNPNGGHSSDPKDYLEVIHNLI